MYGLFYIEKLRLEKVNYWIKLDIFREIWNEKVNLLIFILWFVFLLSREIGRMKLELEREFNLDNNINFINGFIDNNLFY